MADGHLSIYMDEENQPYWNICKSGWNFKFSLAYERESSGQAG